MSLEIREALAPVIDWYHSDEHPDRNTVDIVSDVVSDLQEDRAALINAQRIAQDARNACLEGAPISAHNLALDILEALGVGMVRSPTAQTKKVPTNGNV